MATSLLTSFQCCAYQSSFDNCTGALSVSRRLPYSIAISPSSVLLLPRGSYTGGINSRPAKTKTIAIRATISDNDPNESDKEDSDQSAPDAKSNDNKDDKFRKDLERIVGKDDSAFSGLDLANLIRNKYGRSYDVTLIKKEFMGRNLLAMNVMWKYREQQSFPLTEEEYLLRLDDVANNLKCWGAVSHIRNSLAKVKERPRIGKVQATMLIKQDKMRRFLHDGQATFFYYELKHGYQWRRTLGDLQAFEQACIRLNREISKKVNARKEDLFRLMQIQECKSVVWMEGPLGWTAWVVNYYDVLS